MSLTHEQTSVALKVQNSRTIDVLFHLEPWGDQYVMHPGMMFEIVAQGPVGDSLELVFTDDSIMLWGWAGSVVNVFFEGTEIDPGAWARSAVPPLP